MYIGILEEFGVRRTMIKVQRPYDFFKRGIDLVGSLMLIVLTSPVQLIVAFLIALRLGRPVFFRQSRPGKDGKVFTLLKFRTMLNLDESRGITSNEQRMTPFGSRLRSTSLDELPSLWNVLRGDMSLVGPRPLLVKYLPLYSEEQARRHEVRPGLTGLAQVNGRNALDWNSRFKFDVYYVDNRSIRLDLQILMKTAFKVVKRDGIATDGHVVGAPFEGTDKAAGGEVK